MKLSMFLLHLLFSGGLTLLSFNSLFAQQKVDAEHVIVYHAEDRFAGWPANCAAEIFQDDVIVTGFIEGPYKMQDGHNIAKPYHVWLAKSKDGGRTWNCWNPKNYAGDFGPQPDLKTLDEPINFLSPGFMMRIVGTGYHGAEDPRGHFFYSYNKGDKWYGPFNIQGINQSVMKEKYGLDEFTPRTDYVITGKNECLIFISARKKGEFGTDRLFCIKTMDGGRHFNFQGWVVKPFNENPGADSGPRVQLYPQNDRNPYATECRAVMSSSLRLDEDTLFTAVRRKYIVKGGTDKHWIDLYFSSDGGKTWKFRSKICDTGPHNGNPPAMETTADKRLCVAYGDREDGKVKITYSSDNGMTWENPRVLMDGFWSEDMEYNDLGYPRLFRRQDDKMVAVFYFSTKENPHHLHACIWNP